MGPVLADIQDPFYAVQGLVDAGRYREALKLCRKLVARNPTSPRILLRLGDVHLKLEQHDKACSAYERVAEQYYHTGDVLKAIAVYKHIHHIISCYAPHLEPRYAHCSVRMAQLFLELRLDDDASFAFERAASSLRRDGREAELLAVLHDYVRHADFNPVARVLLGEAEARAGNIDQAVDHLGRAAEQLLALGRRDEALRVLESLLNHRGVPAQAQLAARLYLERGSRADGVAAVAKLKLCFEADRNDRTTLDLLAEAFELIGEHHKAAEVRRQVDFRFPSSPSPSASSLPPPPSFSVLRYDYAPPRSSAPRPGPMDVPPSGPRFADHDDDSVAIPLMRISDG
jgi:tetratricopeptide (TPR) repeat protein